MPRPADPRTALLRVLGVGRPCWRRRWIAEDELLSVLRDRESLLQALDDFQHDPEMVLELRTTQGERYWLLRSAPRVRESVRPKMLLEEDRTAPVSADDADETSDFPVSEEDASEREPALASVPDRGSGATRHGLEVSSAADAESFARSDDPTVTEVQRLRCVLHDLGVRVRSIAPDPQVGPNVTRHLVELAPGTRISTLRTCAEDIARGLASSGSVLISNMPEEGRVAVDVPRRERECVPLASAVGRLPVHEDGGLWFPVGVTPAGKQISLDLGTLPHLLIGGASGSGKSIFLQVLLLSLATCHSPARLEFIVVDLKGVDFTNLAGLPHFHGRPVVDSAKEALAILGDLADSELARRTEFLQDAGCVNVRELHASYPGAAVRQMVLVIDEYAELVSVLSKPERAELERQLLRLAQRARAVGIHLVVATQRPTTDFISGGIKANLPARVAFRLPQRVDSLVILDQPGAEGLLGAGDLLLLHDGRLQRMQGYFASTQEVRGVVESIVQPRGEET